MWDYANGISMPGIEMQINKKLNSRKSCPSVVASTAATTAERRSGCPAVSAILDIVQPAMSLCHTLNLHTCINGLVFVAVYHRDT